MIVHEERGEGGSVVVVAVVEEKKKRRGRKRIRISGWGDEERRTQPAAPCREPCIDGSFMTLLLPSFTLSLFYRFLFPLHANRIGCHVMSHVISSQFPIGQSKRLHLHFTSSSSSTITFTTTLASSLRHSSPLLPLRVTLYSFVYLRSR